MTNPGPVWRQLPLAYRRGRPAAGETEVPASPMHSLVGAMTRSITELQWTAEDVLRSRFLDFAPARDDLARLAAWYRLAPWPDEDLEAFRRRVQRMVLIYREGAATAERMLGALAAAMGADIATEGGRPAVFVPCVAPGAKRCADGSTHGNWPPSYSALRKFLPDTPDPFATYAVFTKTIDGREWAIPAALLDLPKQMTQVPTSDAPEYHWELEPRMEIPELDDSEETYADPVVKITAPDDREVTLPILVQLDLRRLILINRTIPAGQLLRVDLSEMQVADGDPSRPSTKVLDWEDDLLFATGGFLNGDFPGPDLPPYNLGSKTPAFRTLGWVKAAKLVRTKDQKQLLDGRTYKDGTLPWPHLLRPYQIGANRMRKTVRWRLMQGQNLSTPGQTHVRPVPATFPVDVTFWTGGRRPGTFSLFYNPRWVSGPQNEAPHRAAWLQEQIERLKLVGVTYVPQELAQPVSLPQAGPFN